MTTNFITHEKGPRAGNTGPFENQSNKSNSLTGTISRKYVTFQIERLVLAGYAVLQGTHGDFLLTKNGICSYCCDFDELEACSIRFGRKSHG